MVLPLIIQALASQTARGSSSCTRRASVEWEIKSGITNIRGRGVVSTKGEETFGGTTGMKDIIQEWAIESGVGDPESRFGLSTILKAMGFIYSFPWVRTVGRPYGIRVRTTQNVTVCERSKPKYCEYLWRNPRATARANHPGSALDIELGTTIENGGAP